MLFDTMDANVYRAPALLRFSSSRIALRAAFLPLAVLLFVAAFARPAHAAKDSVEFFNNVDVASGEEAHDVVVLFGNANIDGTATGDVVVLFGSVHLRGVAHHDVVNIFGSVQVENDATVGQNLVNIFGETRIGERASVGHDTVVIFGALHAAPSASFGGNRVVQPFLLFLIPIVILALLIRALVGAVRCVRRPYYIRGQ